MKTPNQFDQTYCIKKKLLVAIGSKFILVGILLKFQEILNFKHDISVFINPEFMYLTLLGFTKIIQNKLVES